MNKIITRKEYMENSSDLHDKYYAQFINYSIRLFVEKNYSKEFIQECYKKDEHLNNLGEGWMKKFDRYAEIIKGEIAGINKKINGQSVWSYCDVTCAIKVYMKIYAGIIVID